MDPYLEDPVHWSGFHQGLITFLTVTLNKLLPPRYLADMGERTYVVQSARNIYPGSFVIKTGKQRRKARAGVGGTALAEAGDPPWVITVEPVRVREVFVTIRLVADRSKVVTI